MRGRYLSALFPFVARFPPPPPFFSLLLDPPCTEDGFRERELSTAYVSLTTGHNGDLPARYRARTPTPLFMNNKKIKMAKYAAIVHDASPTVPTAVLGGKDCGPIP